MTRTTTIRFALPIALLLAATTARAQSQPTATSSYRWEAAAADAVSVSVAVAGFSLEGKDGSLNYIPSNVMMGVGSAGYFLGAPLVHVAHKHYGRAAVSLALRVGLPVVGAAIGARMANCPNESSGPFGNLCGLEELGQGFALGAAAAVVVDNVLLYSLPGSDEPEPTAARPARPPARLSIEPRLAAGPHAAVLGVGGRF